MPEAPPPLEDVEQLPFTHGPVQLLPPRLHKPPPFRDRLVRTEELPQLFGQPLLERPPLHHPHHRLLPSQLAGQEQLNPPLELGQRPLQARPLRTHEVQALLGHLPHRLEYLVPPLEQVPVLTAPRQPPEPLRVVQLMVPEKWPLHPNQQLRRVGARRREKPRPLYQPLLLRLRPRQEKEVEGV